MPSLLALVVGAALVSVGCWLAYRPAGLVVAGTLILVGVLNYERSER